MGGFDIAQLSSIVNWHLLVGLPLLLIILFALVHPPFARILWACRVSTVSAFGGYLLFLFVIQAQDLFSDTTFGDHWISIYHILYWTGFFFVLFFVWAFPVHYAARNILDERQNEWFLPRPVLVKNATTTSVASPLGNFDESLIKWTPRVLGTIPIVSVLIGIVLTATTTWHARALEPGLSIQYFLLFGGGWVTLAIFLTAMVKRRAIVPLLLSDPQLETIKRFSIFLTTTIFIFLCVMPIYATDFFARAALVPVLFGSWVLPFSWITKQTDRTGRPLLLYLIIVASLLTAWNVHFNDVRTFVGNRPAVNRQLDLGEAVKLWRAANGCPVSSNLRRSALSCRSI